MSAKIVLSDGREIVISEQTEMELREAFGVVVPKDYKDGSIQVRINVESSSHPIRITTVGNNVGMVSRGVVDIEELIMYLQVAVEYCKLNGLTD